MELLANKKPSPVQIQVVEAIGILMRVPMRAGKSRYKAPSPTNYDDTVDLLASDFSGVVSTVAAYTSDEIPNDIARELYAKTLEPGFAYEAAALFADGGVNLILRDLFNSLVLIVQKMQEDRYRIPVKQRNVVVLMDGSRSSYAAVDVGVHIFNHGLCKLAVMKVRDGLTRDDEILENHIPEDMLRRCVQQYKIPDHCFEVEQLTADNVPETVDLTRSALEKAQSTTLVMGVDVNTSTDRGNLREVLRWAAWEKDELTLVLAKSCSVTRPFTSLHMPRTFMVVCKSKDDLPTLFENTVSFMNPDDFVILYCLSSNRAPEQDTANNSRFGLGNKAMCWAQNEADAQQEAAALEQGASTTPIYPGWNDEYNKELKQQMESILEAGQVMGRARIDHRDTSQSVAVQIMQCAFEEKADVCVVQRKADLEVSLELVQDGQCCVVLC